MASLPLCLRISGDNDVVDVRGYEGLDLHVLFLLEQLLHHLDVTVFGVFHQNEVGCQALLHSTFGILGDPLEVSANLNRKQQLLINYCLLGKKLKLGLVWDVTHLIRHRHASKSLDGSHLH